MRKRSALIIIFGVLLLTLIGLCVHTKYIVVDGSISYIGSDTIMAVTSSSVISNELSKETAFNILNSTVRVRSENRVATSSGSGVVIWTGKKKDTIYSYIITNHHVVIGSDSVVVEQFNYLENKKIAEVVTYEGRVVDISLEKDLALIEVKAPSAVALPASFLTIRELDSLALYDPVYSCGCTLGGPPFITSGNLAIYDNKYHTVTSFGLFGSSGGGVYLKNGKILGIVAHIRVVVLPDGQQIPEPNMTKIITSSSVIKWLATTEQSFVIGPAYGSFDDYVEEQKTDLPG